MTDIEEDAKIVVKKIGVVTKGTCCFCGQGAEVIASEIDSKKTICFRCVYKINFQLGKIPAGAICCFKCRSIAGFKVETHQNKDYLYSMTGRDYKGCVKYELKEKTPPGASAETVSKSRIKKVSCTKCEANIPRWMLDFTSHV